MPTFIIFSSALFSPIAAISTKLTTRVIEVTITTFKNEEFVAIGIYENIYAIADMATILQITSFANSIIGNLYNLFKYHNLTNSVAKLMTHRTTRTLFGEYPSFRKR